MFLDLEKAGVPVQVARSIDDVEETLRFYSIPMREFIFAQKSDKTSKGRRPQKPAHGAASAAPQAKGA